MENQIEENGLEDLFAKWTRRLKRNQLAHRLSAKALARQHLFLGIPAVVLATLVGASVFASLENVLPLGRITVGLVSVSVAILSALQTFLNLDETAKKHQSADSAYGALRQSLEQAFVFDRANAREELRNLFESVRVEMARISDESPLASERYWQRAREHTSVD